MHKLRGRIKATVKWNSISSFTSTFTDFLQSGFEEDNGTGERIIKDYGYHCEKQSSSFVKSVLDLV